MVYTKRALALILCTVIAPHIASTSAQSCNDLLCTEFAEKNSCRTGYYLGYDCTCSACPNATATSEWTFNCLTRELKACPIKVPTAQCDYMLCSNSETTCADAARYPDSACMCVDCPNQCSSNERLVSCLKQRGFCSASAPEPSPTTPISSGVQNCSEQELMWCRNCSSIIHHRNGSCRACPAIRAADRPANCDNFGVLPVAVVIVSACLVVVLLVGGFLIYWFKFLCNTHQTYVHGPAICDTCGKNVEGPVYESDSARCKCPNFGKPPEGEDLLRSNALS